MLVGLSMIVYGKSIQKMLCQNAWEELRGPNTRMLKVSFVSLKQSAAWKPLFYLHQAGQNRTVTFVLFISTVHYSSFSMDEKEAEKKVHFE